jgi:hypothetical protein
VGARRSGKAGSAQLGPTARERGSRPAQTASKLPTAGKVSFSFLFFLFYIFQSIFPLKFLNQFCNPVKTTHYNKAYAPA